MCELLGMSSRRHTELTLSLQTLASHSASPSKHRDGWGAAFYQDKDVVFFREPVAASDSPLARFLTHQVPRTQLAIAHIRHATIGEVTLANTQPFARECMGRMHVFAHNGDLPGIRRSISLAFDRYRPVGTTDSEHAFCALLERFTGFKAFPSLGERLAVLEGFAADIRKLGTSNFLYVDGDTLFAYGDRRTQAATGKVAAPGLFLHTCVCLDEKQSIRTPGLTIGPGFQELALVTSVPFTQRAGAWRPFAEGELIAISDGRGSPASPQSSQQEGCCASKRQRT